MSADRPSPPLYRSLDELPARYRGGAVAVGNFDGVHVGHAAMIAELVAAAREAGGPAVVFTFDPPPSRILRPRETPPPLTPTDRKAELLVHLGVDAVLAYPADEALLALSPRTFFEKLLCGKLGARAVVEGPNFTFGKDRRGDVALLHELCGEAGVRLRVVEPVLFDGQMVSSSRIRGLIVAGRVGEARTLLTEPYRIRGEVIHGAGRGATIGYPTANLAGVENLLPGEGIYAGRAMIDGRTWPAAMSLGANPTFGENHRKIEAYVIGFEGDLYDRPLDVDFLARLRDVERFASVDALLAQMARDVEAAKRVCAEARESTL